MNEDTPEANKKKRLYYRGGECARLPLHCYYNHQHDYHIKSTLLQSQEHKYHQQTPSLSSTIKKDQVLHNLSNTEFCYLTDTLSFFLSIPNLVTFCSPSRLILSFSCFSATNTLLLIPVRFVLDSPGRFTYQGIISVHQTSLLACILEVPQERLQRSTPFYCCLFRGTKAPTPLTLVFGLFLCVINALLYRVLVSQLLKFGHLNKYLRHLPPVR